MITLWRPAVFVVVFDVEGCESVGAGGEDLVGEARLGAMLALVSLDGTALDFQIIGFVKVDHFPGSLGGILGHDGCHEGDIA